MRFERVQSNAFEHNRRVEGEPGSAHRAAAVLLIQAIAIGQALQVRALPQVTAALRFWTVAVAEAICWRLNAPFEHTGRCRRAVSIDRALKGQTVPCFVLALLSIRTGASADATVIDAPQAFGTNWRAALLPSIGLSACIELGVARIQDDIGCIQDDIGCIERCRGI
jgi:hypothetical protein